MRLSDLRTTLAITAFSTAVAARGCSSNLIIDDFSRWDSHTNSIGSWTSDDGSMTSISSTTSSSKSIEFTPNSAGTSYIYTTFEPCLNLLPSSSSSSSSSPSSSYTAIQFSIKAPKDSSVTLELQTSATCGDDAYNSSFYEVKDLMGEMQVVVVPLEKFVADGAENNVNLGVVGAVAWEEFSMQGMWEIGSIELVCGEVGETGESGGECAAEEEEEKEEGSGTGVDVSSAKVQAPAADRTEKIESSTKIPATAKTTTKVATAMTTSVSSYQRELRLRNLQLNDRAVKTTAACTNLLIDDWISQSRLTFLGYNAMLQPSNDDGTMTSVVVNQATNRVTLTPAKSDSYFYSQFDCINAKSVYGGIGMRIKAAAGTTFTIELQSSSSCSTEENNVGYDQTTKQLGWTFDGTEKMYYIPFSKFGKLDTTKIVTLLFQDFGSGSKAITLGPMGFYCGDTGSEVVLPPRSTVSATPTQTVPVTSGTAAALVIDTFGKQDSNSLGFWHGADDDTQVTISGNKLTIKYTDTDLAYYTQITDSCKDFTAYTNEYLHIVFSGSSAFSVALQQHNSACDETINPYPETWDEVYAPRYAISTTEIYIPISHFQINMTRAVGFAFKGFTGKAGTTTFSKVEVVKTVPSGTTIPSRVPNAPLIFQCTRPNSFAFCIDDGDPKLAQQVLKTVKDADIKVTFFTVGAALEDESTNLTNVYKEMLSQGHQVAYHSFTHPPMEGLGDVEDIDWELSNDIDAMKSQLGITSKYFRPPFGNEAALLREQIAANIEGAKTIMWDVDVQDWVWALTDTPEKQLDAFQSDVDKGGNLVVMHYLYQTTVDYLPQFIAKARATGKQLMRLDQCLEDPDAPPL